MDIQAIISSAAVSALITVLGGVFVANISRKTATETAKREMEKLERTWSRDDVVSSDDEFAEMAALVSKFVCFATGGWQVDALSKVAEVRSRENGKLGDILDKLYVRIEQQHYREADALLTEAIAEKRRLKQSSKTSAK